MANQTTQYGVDIPSSMTALGGGTFFQFGHAFLASGRDSGFDGKALICMWDDSSTETPDGKDIFKPYDLTDEQAGRWKRLKEFTEPAGVIKMYGGDSAPYGYLLCDGTAVSRTTYADLFSIIGTAYGTGDGSTTFNVPDLRQRFPLGKSSSGTGSSLGASGGNIDHSHGSPLTTGQPSGTSGQLVGVINVASATHTHQVTVPADNPPYMTVNFIIKT